MSLWRQLVLAPVFLASVSAGSHKEVLCQGFLPENDLQIPVSINQVGGVTQSDFNQVLDQVEQYYRPIVERLGGNLVINRRWSSATVNASAERMGRTYTLNMFGGLARHQVMTKDGFMLVACHEMGHHLAGAPKIREWGGGSWASNEGQADYYATLRCMRHLLERDDNSKWVANNTVDPVLKRKCEEIYTTQEEENLCMRLGMAGFTGASLFYVMREETTPIRFDTPDPNRVSQMFDDHPATQCRLDTYYQGSICFHDKEQPLSDTNPNQGTCSERNGQRDGLRPRCWFTP